MSINDDEDREVREVAIQDARAAFTKPWRVDRRDSMSGEIRYEIWADDGTHRICVIGDEDNPTAKRDAEHIATLHNEHLTRAAKLAEIGRKP